MPESGATQLGDRARGCILGGAIGDAMGGPFEGQPARFDSTRIAIEPSRAIRN
jgi:hypothetical protein